MAIAVVPPPDDEFPWRPHWISVQSAAALTCGGVSHAVNHEAVGLVGTHGRTDAVLTHGLPNSSTPERAVFAAVDSGLAALGDCRDVDPITSIQRAYDQVADERERNIGWDVASPNWNPVRRGLLRRKNYPEPPATIWLAVCVLRKSRGAEIAFGWVGNSRVYWLPQHGIPTLLTTDHYIPFRNPPGFLPQSSALRGTFTHWVARTGRRTWTPESNR